MRAAVQSTTEQTHAPSFRMVATGATFFLIGSIIFTIFSFASTGSVGGQLYATTKKTEQLQEQNRILTQTLAQKQSLRELQAKALEKGFVPISTLTQVKLPDTKVALDIVR